MHKLGIDTADCQECFFCGRTSTAAQTSRWCTLSSELGKVLILDDFGNDAPLDCPVRDGVVVEEEVNPE